MTDSEVVPVDPEDRRLARELALPEPDTRPTLAIFREVAELAEAIARTNFVPKQYRGNPAECTACMLAGHELGLQPMASLNGIDMIEGRASLSARLMRAIVLAAGHTVYFEEASITRVTIVGKRRGEPQVSKVTWTADDTERAGLHMKDVHKKYPRAMLKARATGELCRDLFADVITGIGYTAEEVRDGWHELEDPPDEPDGTEPTKVTAEGAAAKTTGKRAPARKRAAAKTSAQPTTDEPTPPPSVPLPGEDDIVDMVEGADGVHAPAGTEPPTQQPEDPATAAERDQDPDDKPAMTKAQRIAMKAGELELDRGEVIYAVTDGRKTSGRELEDAEADMVLEALRRLKVGEVRLEEDDDGSPVLVEAPETPNEEAVETEPVDPDATGAEVDWTQEQWIAYLRPRKVKMVPVLKEAKRLAAVLIEGGDTGLKVPDNLGAVRGHASLASMTRAYVEEQAGEA